MVNAGAILVLSLLLNLSEVDMSLAEKFDWVMNYFKVSFPLQHIIVTSIMAIHTHTHTHLQLCDSCFFFLISQQCFGILLTMSIPGLQVTCQFLNLIPIEICS